MVVVYHILLTLLKQVRRSGRSFSYLKRIKTDQEIDLPAIPNFAEADSSLAVRLLSRFSTDNYTPALPINSPPEVYERTQREREAEK